MTAPKTIEQIIAEEQARHEERSRDLAEFARVGLLYQQVGADFQRLAAKLGIPLPELNLPLAAKVVPAASSKEALNTSVAFASVEPPHLTIGQLIEQYRAHPDSGFQKLKFRVRQNYEAHLNRLVDEIGLMELREFNSDVLMRLYSGWCDGGKIATGHGMIGKLRLLSTFGVTVLKDEDAVRLSTILNKIRVPTGGGKRTERLTAEHARLIRAKAHEMRWHSIALIQAFQFDFADKFGQIDIIGEWIPLDEPGDSIITRTDMHGKQEKWLRGILWSEVDDRLILRHLVTSGRASEQKLVTADLKRGAMVMEEINRLSPMDKMGPLAICEMTGKPWTAVQFRQRWRQVANLAGIPKEVRNADSGRTSSDDDAGVESGVFA